MCNLQHISRAYEERVMELCKDVGGSSTGQGQRLVRPEHAGEWVRAQLRAWQNRPTKRTTKASGARMQQDFHVHVTREFAAARPRRGDDTIERHATNRNAQLTAPTSVDSARQALDCNRRLQEHLVDGRRHEDNIPIASQESVMSPPPLPPRIILVPHASVQWSGIGAASSYACVQPFAKQYARVLLVAPHHTRTGHAAILLPPKSERTFAGLTIDRAMAERLVALSSASFVQHFAEDAAGRAAYAQEHSVHHQAEFLQAVFADCTPTILPLVVQHWDRKLAVTLADVCRMHSHDTLVVLSSDLTHYGRDFQLFPFDDVDNNDDETASSISLLDRIRAMDSHAIRVLRVTSTSEDKQDVWPDNEVEWLRRTATTEGSTDWSRSTGAMACGHSAMQLVSDCMRVAAAAANKTSLFALPQCYAYYTSEHERQALRQRNLAVLWSPTGGRSDKMDARRAHCVSYASMVWRQAEQPQATKGNVSDIDLHQSFVQQQRMLWTPYEQFAAKQFVRRVIASGLNGGRGLFRGGRQTSDEWLQPFQTECMRQRAPGLFVTLTAPVGGSEYQDAARTVSWALRGCIGHVPAIAAPAGSPTKTDDRVVDALAMYAIASAFGDSRFAPLSASEWGAGDDTSVRIEISILSSVRSIAHDITQIVLGRHGIYVQHRASGGSAVYLPQVATEQGWDLRATLQSLLHKNARIRRSIPQSVTYDNVLDAAWHERHGLFWSVFEAFVF